MKPSTKFQKLEDLGSAHPERVKGRQPSALPGVIGKMAVADCHSVLWRKVVRHGDEDGQYSFAVAL
jgi:hypothetical protein